MSKNVKNCLFFLVHMWSLSLVLAKFVCDKCDLWMNSLLLGDGFFMAC